MFTQELFQCLKSARSHQTRFQAAPAQDLPFQGHHIGYEHFIDDIDRVYGCADAAEKFVDRRRRLRPQVALANQTALTAAPSPGPMFWIWSSNWLLDANQHRLLTSSTLLFALPSHLPSLVASNTQISERINGAVSAC